MDLIFVDIALNIMLLIAIMLLIVMLWIFFRDH